MKYYVIAFDSSHKAIKFEKMIKEKNITTYEIMPTPRGISVSCGISMKIDAQDMNDIIQVIDQMNFKGHQIYEVTDDGKDKNYQLFTA